MCTTRTLKNQDIKIIRIIIWNIFAHMSLSKSILTLIMNKWILLDFFNKIFCKESTNLKDKYGFFPFEYHFKGHTTKAINCVYFHFDFISRKQKKKPKKLYFFDYISKIYFLIQKMGLYAAMVVIQNEWLKWFIWYHLILSVRSMTNYNPYYYITLIR